MSINRLRNVLSNMKVSKKSVKLPKEIESKGNSNMFTFALSDKQKGNLQTKELKKWNELTEHQMKMARIQVPLNGFEELIQMTEEGKLWRYPIDNEQGLDEEKKVPFEDHVFLEDCLKDFPKDEYIKGFMEFVISGLARNHWITVDRKHEVIRFYKEYFDKKQDLYKSAGL